MSVWAMTEAAVTEKHCVNVICVGCLELGKRLRLGGDVHVAVSVCISSIKFACEIYLFVKVRMKPLEEADGPETASGA